MVESLIITLRESIEAARIVGIWGSGLALGLIAVVGTAVLLAFDWLWLQFHCLAFPNEFWSAEGYMIPIFGSFWYGVILIALGFMAALAVLLSVPSVNYVRLTEDKRQVIST